MSKKRLTQETSIQTELMFDDDVLSCCLYTKGITIRVPIVDMKKANDPNRILMIKSIESFLHIEPFSIIILGG